MAKIISFTMNFERERLDVRFDDNTETCIRYRDILPKLIKPVKVTEKQVDMEVKSKVEKISQASDLSDEERKKMVVKAQATSERAKARKHIENRLAIDAADKIAKKIISDIKTKMSGVVAKVLEIEI